MAVYKLKDIATVNMCKRVLSKETSKNGEIPFYKIGTLGNKPDSFIKKELFLYLKNKYKYPELGDSLISCSGTIGKVIEFNGKDAYFQDSNIVWLVTSKLIKKYTYYWLSKKPFLSTQGATIKRLYNSDIKNTYIFIPAIKVQKQIIDIIKQDEKLFLRHSNCVRIDTLKNVQTDMKNLIDIIKPLEDIEINLLNIKNKLIKFLINLYNRSNHNNQIIFNSVIKILVSKYENQINYFATNAVGEMQIDYEKIINLSEKIPSRANISPWKDSFIFSKLAGENKIFYFKNKPQEVFSTGFFNFKTKHHDHILGFMLSNDFKKQKEYLATGTTMQSINNSSLKLIRLNKPNLKSSIITTTLYDLENNLTKIKKLKTKLINILIK